MSYVNEGIDQRAEVLIGTTDTLLYWPKADGANVTPTSATVEVRSPSGAVLVPAAAVVVGANGRLPLSQAWPEATYPIGEDYRATWQYVVSGLTYSDYQFFDVVRTKLLCLISEDELLELYPDLNTHLAGVGESDPGKFVRRGWSTLLDRIRTGGNRPSLILEKSRLVNPAIHISLHFACQALAKDVGGLWDKRADTHLQWYEKLMGGLGQLKYDVNEDAQADRQETTRVARVKFSV